MLKATRMSTGCGCQIFCIGGRVIRQWLGLEPTPTILHRIEFRRIGRKPFQMNAPMASHIGLDAGAAMRPQPIPEQHETPVHMATQLPQKRPHLVPVHVAGGIQPKTQPYTLTVWADDQGGDDRNFLVLARALSQHGRQAATTPTALHQRRHQQAALVGKDQRGVQAAGFFLMRGHCCLTQRLMAASSRSRALRAGRCGLHPSACISRPT